jgi:polyisoprenoid-binding protein YceI
MSSIEASKWMPLGLLWVATSVIADLSAVPSGGYGLDKSHAYLTFSYSHLGFSHPVITVGAFDVALDLDSAAPEKSRLSVTADAASIDSGVVDFNDHLHGPEYFDVGKHPEITFASTAIVMTGEDTATITGDLTIKGVTKPLTLTASLNKAAMHPMQKVPVVGVSATGTLKRSEFGLGQYAPAVGDEVSINVEVELPLR